MFSEEEVLCSVRERYCVQLGRGIVFSEGEVLCSARKRYCVN